MTDPAASQVTPNASPRFFPVSLLKLSVLSIFSLGAYDFYLFYRHWKHERSAAGVALSPVLRAVFGPLFAYSLFKRMRAVGAAVPGAPGLSAGLLALGYFLWVGTWRLPDPYWLVSLFSFVPLLPAQRAANAINAHLAPAADRNTQFSGANVIWIIVGTLLLGLLALGMLLPADAGVAAPADLPAVAT